jgi:hypothetical protein
VQAQHIDFRMEVSMFQPGDFVKVQIDRESVWALVRDVDSASQTLTAVRNDGSEAVVEFGQVTASTSADWNRLCAGR